MVMTIITAVLLTANAIAVSLENVNEWVRFALLVVSAIMLVVDIITTFIRYVKGGKKDIKNLKTESLEKIKRLSSILSVNLPQYKEIIATAEKVLNDIIEDVDNPQNEVNVNIDYQPSKELPEEPTYSNDELIDIMREMLKIMEEKR